MVALHSAAGLTTATALAALRGEDAQARALEWAILGLFGAVALLSGWVTQLRTASATPLVLALVAIGAQLLVERVPVRHRRWWASPGALLLVLAPFASGGVAQFGLAAVALYAFGTLAAAIEGTREKA